jgi:enamine deaminase RidA (YjgF/YER057c/UK114 family)
MTTKEKLTELGIELPSTPAPAGNYVPAYQAGKLLYVSGAICIVDGAMTHTGKVGEACALEDAREAARICALNLLAVAQSAVGDLDQIKHVVHLGGFVNAVPGFPDSPAVINGASDLMVQILGDRGRHTRAAVAVTGLPKNSTVEITGVFEIN